MSYRYLTISIFLILQSQGGYAKAPVSDLAKAPSNEIPQSDVPSTTLPSLTFHAEPSIASQKIVAVKTSQSDVHTLGEAIDKVSSVHAGGFGPHSSSPIIRGLSGNRVYVKEDGVAINELNAISPTSNSLFDAVFSQTITVNKANDGIRSGGHGIGGSLEIDSGLISRQMEEKANNLTITAKGGSNAPSSYGIKANINNQDNVSVNLLYSGQHLDSYDIVGDSKASVCQNDIVSQNKFGLGINTVLADACQIHVEKTTVFNPKSKKYLYPDYIDPTTLQFTQKYYDYELSPGDVYTNQKTNATAINPQYVEGQPESTQNIRKITDVTENFHGTLGNSQLDNRRFAASTTYFLDGGYIAASIDHKISDYGLPGFSLSNLAHNQDYTANLPVTIHSEQNKYLLEGNVDTSYPWFNHLEFNLAQRNEKNNELLGNQISNHFDFNTRSATLLTHHQPTANWLGVVGLDLSRREIQGDGKQRFLPDVTTNKKAVFLTETLDINPVTLNFGYRYENVNHDIANQKFVVSRNSPNKTLKDTHFDLNSYELGAKFQLNPNIGLQVRYTDAQRAPEVNELYASGGHYSTMTHEEGNQKATPENVQTTEISGIFKANGYGLTATAYQHDFDDYFYLKPSGATTLANRLPLKYWQQIDTKVTGFEVDVDKVFNLNQYGMLKVNAFSDWVKNKPKDRKENGDYLINIPTSRYGLGLNWDYNQWQSGINAVYYAKPKFLGKDINTEVALPSYTLVDFTIARKFKWHDSDVSVFVSGNNLLNEDARPHNSPLRYIAPLPGRSIGIGMNLTF